MIAPGYRDVTTRYGQFRGRVDYERPNFHGVQLHLVVVHDEPDAGVFGDANVVLALSSNRQLKKAIRSGGVNGPLGGCSALVKKLAYSIAEGSNPIKYPLTSASTLKRHYTFSSSNTFDDWAAKDAFIAYKNLSQNLSAYLGRPPVDEAYRLMQVGDDPDQFLADWDYMMSICDAEDPEPWRRDFQVTEKDTESGPPMVLHFPPMRKSSWTALRTGLGIWGFSEMENHKKDPPSKDRIAAYQEFRRNNPVTDMRKLHSEEIENHGS